MKLIPKNWSEFQHYKDRKPQWIKLHRDLLNDFSYSLVQIGTKATLPLLWLLACEYEDGVIDATVEEISFRIHIDVKPLNKAIEELLKIGYFTSDSNLVQIGTDCYPREEKRREEREVNLYEKKDNFSLSKKSSYDNVSEDYKKGLEKFLKEYIENLELKILQAGSSKVTLAYEDYILQLEAKGYQYKNFVSAYITWNRKV